jgi:hypothetical protein
MVVIHDFPELIGSGFWENLEPTNSQPSCIFLAGPFRTKFTGGWEHNNRRSKHVVGNATIVGVPGII